jgi:phosphopantothenoylcysteine synthetase/decarboxylase
MSLAPATPQFLVTAGNTREPIDRVRDWGNIFTGNTGLAVAKALAELGSVDLLTSNRQHIAELTQSHDTRFPIQPTPFTTHAELKSALAQRLAAYTYDAIFMTAAVADYRPAGVFQLLDRKSDPDGTQTWTVKPADAPKVKSNHPAIAILGHQTEKLVDLFRFAWNHKGLLFKFKLEVGITPDQLIQVGQASRKASGADYLVANTLDMVEGENAGAYLLSEQGAQFIPRAQLAPTLARIVSTHVSR